MTRAQTPEPDDPPPDREDQLKDLVPAIATIREQIGALISRPGSPFYVPPPAGLLRGIDVYPVSTLLRVASLGAYRYKQAHGVFPNLQQPKRLSEKIFRANYFRPLKVPETGNKLATGSFLPKHLQSEIALAEIVWRSRKAQLPPDDEIEAGTYYLKTNHGSDMFRRIEWPVSHDQRGELEQEFAGYLAKPYGYDSGEWWYTCIDRALFLERSVSSDPHPIAWCCYTFRSKVALVIAYRKLGPEAETIWLNPDFTPASLQNPSKRRPRLELPSEATRQAMLLAASAIGRPFPFVRVDFLLGDDERIYLSELTFSPGNATTPWPAELDLQLGALWTSAGTSKS